MYYTIDSPEAPTGRSFRTSPIQSNIYSIIVADRNRTDLRRSEPKSRTVLRDEQSHP